MNKIKSLIEAIQENEVKPSENWQLRLINSGDCVSYFLWNEESREYIVVDPKKDDLESYLTLQKSLSDYLCLGIFDTHTHADHISIAAELATQFKAPLVMHEKSQCSRIHLKVCRKTNIPNHTAPLEIIPTPGHTPDSYCVLWGPFLFTGDTVLFGDVGRDDLPGGNATSHYESLMELKESVSAETLVLPGHDLKGGRVSSWKTQLKINSSLTQERADYIRESEAFDAPAPMLFKKSLFENLK